MSDQVAKEGQEGQSPAMKALVRGEVREALATLAKAGEIPSFEVYSARNPEVLIDEKSYSEIVGEITGEHREVYEEAVRKSKQLMSRDDFNKLSVGEQAKYILGGGQLFDAPEPAKADEWVAHGGNKVTRKEWDAMTDKQKWAFCGIDPNGR